MGPYFGIKDGGTGAGRSQVYPSEAINLHYVLRLTLAFCRAFWIT